MLEKSQGIAPCTFFFFQLLIESSNISGEMALKYGNLQSFMLILPKRAEILLYKVAKFYRHFYGWGYQLKFAPNTNVCKIPRLCGAIFVCFKVTFKLGNFTDFKAFSSAQPSTKTFKILRVRHAFLPHSVGQERVTNP